jgi:hypothetical protein
MVHPKHNLINNSCSSSAADIARDGANARKGAGSAQDAGGLRNGARSRRKAAGAASNAHA